MLLKKHCRTQTFKPVVFLGSWVTVNNQSSLHFVSPVGCSDGGRRRWSLFPEQIDPNQLPNRSLGPHSAELCTPTTPRTPTSSASTLMMSSRYSLKVLLILLSVLLQLLLLLILLSALLQLLLLTVLLALLLLLTTTAAVTTSNIGTVSSTTRCYLY